jgi:hypothetical protein
LAWMAFEAMLRPLDSTFRSSEAGFPITGMYLTTLAATDWAADITFKPNLATVGAYFLINLPAVWNPCLTFWAPALRVLPTFWKPFLTALPAFWTPDLILLPTF